MSNDNNNPIQLDADGIDPDVRAIYGETAGPEVLRVLSNNPFTMSNEVGTMVRRDAFLAANKLIQMVMVISEPLDTPEDVAEQTDLVEKINGVIDALGAFIVMSQNAGEGASTDQTFAALTMMGKVCDGTHTFAWSFVPDEEGNLNCGIKVIPVSDETAGA